MDVRAGPDPTRHEQLPVAAPTPDCSALAQPEPSPTLTDMGDPTRKLYFGDAGATVTIDATLTEPGTVSGMMISERTGGPIDGAPVRLYPLDDTNNVGLDWIQVNTIADGTFVIDDPNQLLVAGNYKLEAPGFTDAGGLTWDGEWWEDADTGAATVLVVAVGADTALTGPIGRHGPGALTGTVTKDGSGVLLASLSVNPDGADGLINGGGAFFGKEVVAVLGAGLYALSITYAMLAVINRFSPVKTSQSDEETGVDEALHGETAYV